MQFQDITRQKLERLHKPALGAATESLSLLSHETQALLQRDLYRAVRAYSQSALKTKLAGREGGEPGPLDDTHPGTREDDGSSDKKVELF
jgi:hypothetical protein